MKQYNGFPLIGLTYLANLDNWSWSDGTPFSYSNWRKGQPDFKDQHCVYVSKQINLLFKLNYFLCFFLIIYMKIDILKSFFLENRLCELSK